jgi:hypothetical protein
MKGGRQGERDENESFRPGERDDEKRKEAKKATVYRCRRQGMVEIS